MPCWQFSELLAAAFLLLAANADATSDAAPSPRRIPPVLGQCSSPRPPYPADSKVTDPVGIVKLRYLVDATGALLDVQVQRSSGNERLDTSAVNWARTCRFQPGTLDGTPERIWVTQEIAFHRKRVCATPYPDYPKSSRRDNESGNVIIKYQLDEAGEPVHITVTESTGHPALDGSVIEWLSHCHYDPVDFKDGPRDGWMTQRYTFALRP